VSNLGCHDYPRHGDFSLYHLHGTHAPNGKFLSYTQVLTPHKSISIKAGDSREEDVLRCIGAQHERAEFPLTRPEA
jgi:hypothetical protein